MITSHYTKEIAHARKPVESPSHHTSTPSHHTSTIQAPSHPLPVVAFPLWPFRCCSTWRSAHTLTEFGSPLSRATPPSTPNSRSTLGSTTDAETPPRDDPEVEEVAPPTPGAHVEADPNHPYMPTPVRANQVTSTTPADSAKKTGDTDGHPINLH